MSVQKDLVDVSHLKSSLESTKDYTDSLSLYTINACNETINRYPKPNLLINYYFVNPINQRMVSGTIVNAPVYFLDCWKLVSGSVTFVNGEGLVLTGIIQQILEDPVYGEVTASVLTDRGIIRESDKNPLIDVKVTYKNEGSRGFFEIEGYSVKLLAAKLEYGNSQTLAHQEGSTWVLNDPPPNKAQELTKCQRYQFFLNFDAGMRIRDCQYSVGSIYFFMPTPTTMVSKPKIIYESNLRVFSHEETAQFIDGFTFDVKYLMRNGLIIQAVKLYHGIADSFLHNVGVVGFDANL